MAHRFFPKPLLLLVALAAHLGPTHAADDDAAQATRAVAAFHQALKSGDAKAALQWLADDAQVLEDGELQTREQYRHHHLEADITFAKGVTTTYSQVVANAQGGTAWVSAATDTTGHYKGRPVALNGAELMVLTRSPEGWRIRAIHWSANSRAKPPTPPSPPPLVGGDRDAQGCLTPSGYTWCARESACVRRWELAKAKGLGEGADAFKRHCEGSAP
jgi:ketosteroid isomerase-like protein